MGSEMCIRDSDELAREAASAALAAQRGAAETAHLRARLDEFMAASSSAVQRTEHLSAATTAEFETRMLALEAAGREAVRKAEARMRARAAELRERVEGADARVAAALALVDAEKANTDAVRQEGVARAAKQAVEIGKLRDKVRQQEAERRRKEADLDAGRRNASEREARERATLQRALDLETDRAADLTIHLDGVRARLAEHDADAAERAVTFSVLNARVDDAERSASTAALELAHARAREAVLVAALSDADTESAFELELARGALSRAEDGWLRGATGVRAELEAELVALRTEKADASERLANELDTFRSMAASELEETRSRAEHVERVRCSAARHGARGACEMRALHRRASGVRVQFPHTRTLPPPPHARLFHPIATA